ncbi:unnamed protein product [Scytosiphon promiscuus]
MVCILIHKIRAWKSEEIGLGQVTVRYFCAFGPSRSEKTKHVLEFVAACSAP